MAAYYTDDTTPGPSVPRIMVHRVSNDRDRPDQRDSGTPFVSSPSPEQPSQNEETQSLEVQLWETDVQHANCRTRSFWPPSVLRRVITKEAIEKEIMKTFQVERAKAKDIARRVWQDRSGKCVQVFTILVLLDRVKDRLDHILECPKGVRDHDLPLVLRDSPPGRKRKLCRKGSEAVCCLSGLRTTDLEQFELFQRRLAVPVFKLDEKNNALIHLDLDDGDILPWSEEALVEPVNAMSGGFGTVTRVKIHRDCHHFHSTLKAVSLDFILMGKKKIKVVLQHRLIQCLDQCCRWPLRCQETAAED